MNSDMMNSDIYVCHKHLFSCEEQRMIEEAVESAIADGIRIGCIIGEYDYEENLLSVSAGAAPRYYEDAFYVWRYVRLEEFLSEWRNQK